MKEKLYDIFGTFGIVLFYLLLAMFSVIPFIILDFPIWLILVLTFLISLFPLIGSLASIAFYIWAFVKAVTGPQDFMTIIFYIFFALYFLYGFASFFLKSHSR